MQCKSLLTRLAILILPFAMVLTGCTLTIPTAGRVKSGSGNLITERLDIQGFTEITEIEVPGSWEVDIFTGAFDVQVTVDDNVFNDLRVERRGNVLRFGLRPGTMFRHVTLRAQVAMPNLDAVQVSGNGHVAFAGFQSSTLRTDVSGSGGVKADDCHLGVLEANVSGSGDIILDSCTVDFAAISISGSGGIALQGETAECVGESVSLRISGSGSADLRGCSFADADVRLTGSGDGWLTLGTGDLAGSISGSGSVTYHGAPTRVDVQTSGSGRVIKSG